MNILWTGPLQSPENLLRGTAPHPATMRWQRMFIGGLRLGGHRVRWIGHEPHRTWPWGPLRIHSVSRSHTAEIDSDARQLCYTNIARLRNRSLRKSYREAVCTAIREEQPDVIVSYNADPWMQGVAAAATLESIPWIPLVLDCFNPLDDDWRRFTRDTSLALGVAFISHWAFEHAPVARKHLLAGAVVPRRLPTTASRGEEHPLLLYAGSHSRAGGLDLLIAALPLLKTKGVRLVITGQGKGLDTGITRACVTTPGVEDLGMVPEEELAELAAAANILVNPRPLEFEDNRTNFPSKLLDYLSYLKPIVSTRTAGIGPGYDDIVHFTASDKPADIAAAIDTVLALPDLDRDGWMHRIDAAVGQLTPERAATSLVAWIDHITLNTGKDSLT